ncbi:MAG: right-handed parallel beta-helix repeat-containing protein [Pseudobdellovibrionaceae bacterium]
MKNTGKFFKAILSLQASILILPAISFANSYHVRKDGNDTTCNGSANVSSASAPNCAFLTVQKGINTAQAGDTLNVHAGTYSESPMSARSGSSGSLITLQAATGETATIDRIKISHSYIIVSGFRVVNSGQSDNAGISLTGSNNQAIYNTLIGNCQPWNGGEGCNIGVWSGGDNNIISYNTWDGTNNSTNSFGIGIYLNGSSNNIISHNLMKDINTPGRLFEIYGTGHVISDNEVRNCNNTYENSNVHVDVFQMFNSSSSYNVFERNYIHDFNGQFVMFADWQVPGAIHHWTFRNNVFANIASSAFIKSKDIYFYNNTFYRVGQTENNAIIYSIDSEGDGSNGQFINNILIPNATNLSFGVATTSNTILKNNYYGTATYGPRDPAPETGMINGGDPKFVAAFTDCTANKCDFRIGSDSVVAGKGLTLAGFTTDAAGVTRTSPWSIAAYEPVGTTATISLAAPTNLRIN